MKRLWNTYWARSAIYCFLWWLGADDDEAENEEEVIKWIILTFTRQGGNGLTFTYSDPDGEGTTAYSGQNYIRRYWI